MPDGLPDGPVVAGAAHAAMSRTRIAQLTVVTVRMAAGRVDGADCFVPGLVSAAEQVLHLAGDEPGGALGIHPASPEHRTAAPPSTGWGGWIERWWQ